MRVSISGHHFNISDRFRSYIEDEAAKLERFYTPLIDCQVTLTQENRVMKVGVVVHVQAQNLRATHKDEKPYPAVDGAMDKMERQLKKLHDKRRKPRVGEGPISQEEPLEVEE